MNTENQPQFFFPNLPGNLFEPMRPTKPEGFRSPLTYFAVIATEEPKASIPHWHPNADEFSYFISGDGVVRLTSPAGEDFTFDVTVGDAVLFPQGWPHSFENKNGSENPLKFLAFFNNPEFALVEIDSVPDPRDHDHGGGTA